MEKLIIVGLGPTARHVLSFVQYHKLYEVIGFAVNASYKIDSVFYGFPVYTLENLNEKLQEDSYVVFVALMWNHLNRDRKNLYEYCKAKGYRMTNIISPLAVVRSEIKGDNCWIHDFVVIQNNTVIGNNVFLMAYTLIGGDSVVGSHCFFAARSSMAGGCTIGEQSFVGLSATIFDDTVVGQKCIIGACSAIKRNLPDYSKCTSSPECTIVKQYGEDEIENKLISSLNRR